MVLKIKEYLLFVCFRTEIAQQELLRRVKKVMEWNAIKKK